MKDFNYHLSVQNCRAIKSAEIDLSEITVFTGVNASGKSTLARMLRDLVELSAEYERLLAVQMWNGRMDVWRYIVSGFRGLRSMSMMSIRRVTEKLERGVLTFPDAVSMLEKALQECLADSENGSRGSFFVQRARRVLDLEDDALDLMDKFRQESSRLLEKFERRRRTRSYVAYRELMRGNPLNEGSVTLTEGDHVVFSNGAESQEKLDEISFIKRAIYIESPLKSFPKSISTTELRMEDGFTRLKDDYGPEATQRLHELNEVLSGDFAYTDEFQEDESYEMRALMGRSGHWLYQRKDGQSFDLEECATGVKAMSILSVLHAKGWLDPETLLIIDEPEAHLHPQWIVEYARLLLLLSRRFKVRIVITSHSPDMVNAIHTIGTAFGMGKDIGFYLAECDAEDSFRYNYRGLGNKVGDIFKAYNIAFSRIDDYARRVES